MSDSEKQPQDPSTGDERKASKPSFAGTSIAATEDEQTAARRAKQPHTTDETGETTTAAVPEPESDRTGADERRG